MNLTAADGIYDRKAGMLTLSRDIMLKSTERLRGASRRGGDRHRHRRHRFEQAGRGEDAARHAQRQPARSDQGRRGGPVQRRRDHGSLPAAARCADASGERTSHDACAADRCAPGCRTARVVLRPRSSLRRSRRDGAGTSSARAFPTRCRASRRIAASRCEIEAASLEVRDKDKVATFTGNVKVVQGDTTMRCKSLVVFYEQSSRRAAGDVKAATPGSRRSAARSASWRPRRRDRHPEGPDRHRRHRPVRHAQQHRHPDRQCRGQPGPQRHARRPAGGRPDHRRVAGRCRQVARAGAHADPAAAGQTGRDSQAAAARAVTPAAAAN